MCIASKLRAWCCCAQGSVVPYRAAQLNSQLKTAINLVPQGTVQPSDTMSDLEKRKLSIQLADLQGEQLAELLQVLQDDLPPSGSEEEIELDLDQLPNATLQKMQSFVNRVAGGRGAGAIYAAAPNKQALKQEPARPAAAPTPAPDDDDMAVAGSSGETHTAMHLAGSTSLSGAQGQLFSWEKLRPLRRGPSWRTLSSRVHARARVRPLSVQGTPVLP